MERQWQCACGATVYAYGGYDTSCDHCNQPYNGFGQRLRDDWYENPAYHNDNISDMEGYEIQYACDK